MTDCIFCKIASGDIPCSKVYETQDVLAFDDINPVAPAHVIIIPKRHFSCLMDVGPDETSVFSDLLRAAQEVARTKGIDRKGFRTTINTREEGGQVVPHLHIHVFGGRQLKMELE